MQRLLSSFLSLLSWFAIVAQFVLMFENRTAAIGETLLRFFSFFTILTNTLVAVYLTGRSLGSVRTVFNRPGILTALTVYITVVGLVYQVVLRHIWQPSGLQWIVDELLHTAIPVLVIAYWMAFEDKRDVQWKQVPAYLLYPVVYVVFVLLRGAFSGFYPYPFIHVSNLGWPGVLVNIAGLVGLFLLLFTVFVGGARMIARRKRAR